MKSLIKTHYSPMPDSAPSPKKPFYKKWWFWFLVVILFIAIGSSGGKQPSGTSVPAADDKPITNTQPATPPPPVAQQSLLKISGSGTKSTQKFTAAGDWDLDWNYDCKNFGQQGNFQVMVYNDNGTMSYENTLINQLGESGADVQHYHKGGTYYLTVNSVCTWKIEVKG